MDFRNREWVVEAIRGSELGPHLVTLLDWLNSDQPVSSLRFAEAETVPIPSIDMLEAAPRGMFPRIYNEIFSSASYQSEPFLITRLRQVLLLANGVMLVESGSHAACVAEAIGDSAKFPVNYSDKYQTVAKAAGSTKLSATISEVAEYHDDYRKTINVVLSPINNYGHWHVHNVPFLEWMNSHIREILAITQSEVLRIICPHLDTQFGGFKKAILGRLPSSSPIDIVDASSFTRPIMLHDVLVSSTFNLDNGTNWPVIFRRTFPPLRSALDLSAPELIYCNRSHAGHRGIENEVSLEEALEKIGFITVRPGTMSYDEQRGTFSNARVIVSSHGGALTNMVYSHHRTAIVELSHPFYGPIQYTWFRNLASVFGHRHAAVVCPVPEQYLDKSYKDTYFRVDCDALVNDIIRAVLTVPM
jgi:hypothetical protein